MLIYNGKTFNDTIEKDVKDSYMDKKHAIITVSLQPKPQISPIWADAQCTAKNSYCH